MPTTIAAIEQEAQKVPNLIIVQALFSLTTILYYELIYNTRDTH